MIRDPQGRQNTVEVMMEDKGDNTYRCTYRPTQMGPHVVTVTFGGMGIPKSPFSVDVGPGEPLLHRAVGPSEAWLVCVDAVLSVSSLRARGVPGERPWAAAVGDEGEAGRRLQGGHQERRQRGAEGGR